ncbi:hypothetical protein K438DRAFT_1783690 [Mycena galopus ATCC 62051]|nr:hypothetical protein K438DRAFT_1783690 [Mycena galopus ATCC 62051]
MYSHQPSHRSPVERVPESPPNYNFAGGDLPVLGTPPPWMKPRKNRHGDAAPTPPLPSCALPPLSLSGAFKQREHISVPPQAKHLTVVLAPEDPVLASHALAPRGAKPKGRPHKITVAPVSRPIAVLTAHIPSAPPPISAVLPRTSKGRDPRDRSAPGTPFSPEPSDPELSTGLPRALGMQAFPTRAERSWRHGG